VAAKACGPKNDRMPGQIGRCEGDPGLVEVSSRRGEDPRPCENSPHRRCRVGKRTKPKRDVHAFGHEVFALISIIRSIRSAGCRLMKPESRGMTARTAKFVPNRSAIFRAALRFRAQRVPLRRARLGQTRCEPGSPSRRRSALLRAWSGRTARRRFRAPASRSSGTRSIAECSAHDRPRKSFPCGRPERTAAARRGGRS
jgi:hypothetical protein